MCAAQRANKDKGEGPPYPEGKKKQRLLIHSVENVSLPRKQTGEKERFSKAEKTRRIASAGGKKPSRRSGKESSRVQKQSSLRRWFSKKKTAFSKEALNQGDRFLKTQNKVGWRRAQLRSEGGSTNTSLAGSHQKN